MAKHHLVMDVEATGAYPGEYALLQIGAVDLNGNEFYGEFRPAPHHKFDPNAMNAIGLTKEQVMLYPEAGNTANAFFDWIKDTYKGQRVMSWSDNPGFDWQFINDCLWRYCGSNPLGFSMRRIGDFYAGTVHDVYKASAWKKMRKTAHTHNALDDAKGNAEALEQILAMSKRNART